MTKKKPISEDSKAGVSGGARVFLGLFGLIFLSAGLAVYYFSGLQPYLQKRQATDWPTAECKIKKAEKEIHHGEDSTSYSVDFYYTFEVDGKTFTGTRYSFADAETRREECRRQRLSFPVGSTRDCFYNPQDPNDCVLDRTNQDQGWLPFILPFLFIGIGGLVLCVALFVSWDDDKKSISGSLKSKKSKPVHGETKNALAARLGGSKPVGENPADQLDAQWDEPLKLKPAVSRWRQAIGVGVFALLWNGFVATLIYVSTEGLQVFGAAQIGVGLFMIPFGIIGLCMIFGTIYSVAMILNPTVEIALGRGAVPLGGTVDVAWQVEGRFERIKKLTIHVQAMQHATYKRGTDMTTDVEVFEKLLITESTDVTDVAFGSTSVTIPADSMHTFDAKHNKIKWQVTVHAEIPWAPDINEDYEFRVTPIKTESRTA